MTLQKSAGIAGISVALIYIAAFIYFGVFWQYPAAGSAFEKITYLSENQTSFSLMYFLIYILFGVVLSVLVVGLHERLKPTANQAISIGSLFGSIWVGLVISSGMISTIGLSYVIEHSGTSFEKAYEVWRIVSLIAESIGGGNELVGGLWVLIVSIVALKAKVFTDKLNYLGCFVGGSGVATVYPSEILTIIFGIGQIFWFVWIGISLIKEESTRQSMQPTANAAAD